ESKQIERDIELVKETGCRYHVCHISTKESVQLIRQAKASGLTITCETAPHYLVLTDMEIEDDGRFKMNPPIRSREDRDALIEGLADGTIDIVATDHAPHSAEEKSKGLKGSLNGVIGLDFAFAVLYTKLVLSGKLSLNRLIDAMSIAPRRIFRLPEVKIEEGYPADIAVLDLNRKWTIRGQDSLSKGHSTPFEGMEVQGKNMYTILDGDMIWKNQKEN
ncbi:MAG: amidohydrolase family protein, partial [Clostridia bacterium]